MIDVFNNVMHMAHYGTNAAIDTSHIHVLANLDTKQLWIVALVALVCALAVTATVVWLWQPRKLKAAKKTGAHSRISRTDPWHERIEGVEHAFESGDMSREKAFVALARIAREYASHNLSKDVRTHTLTEFGNESRTGANKHGLDLLRQTIAALYPPEFADSANNAQAKESSVHEAARWVGRLTERWRI